MAREHLNNHEQIIPLEAPSSLRLFTHDPDSLAKLRPRLSTVSQFHSAIISTLKSFNRFNEQSEKRINRLKILKNDIIEDITDVNSASTCGIAYLLITEELTNHNVPPIQAFKFFLDCIKRNVKMNNTIFDTLEVKQLPPYEQYKVALKVAAIDTKKINNYFLINSPLQPDWFTTNFPDQNWPDFIIQHSNLFRYIYGKKTEEMMASGKYGTGELGIVRSTGLPDWFIEMGDDINSPSTQDIILCNSTGNSIVTEELQEGIDETLALDNQGAALISQENYENKNLFKKIDKMLIHTKSRRQSVFPEINTLSDCVMFTEMSFNILNYGIEPKNLLDINYDPTQTNNDEDKKTLIHKEIISQFINTQDGSMAPEMIALWLEKIFKKNKSLSKASEIADPKFLAVCQSALKIAMSSDIEHNLDFNSLSQYDKQLLQSVRYTLTPLLSTIPINNLEKLSQQILSSSSSTKEDIIWLFANTISQSLRYLTPKTTLSTALKVIKDIKNNTINWLLTNQTWVYKQLIDSVQSTTLNPTINNKHLSPSTVTSTPTDTLGQPANSDTEIAIQKDIQAETTRLEAGNLDGWKLFYSEDQNLDDVIEISGTTMEEKENNFTQHIKKNSISCRGEPSTFIRTLDRILSTAHSAEEWTRMRQTINGTTFKKKRLNNGMRLFYVIDYEKNQITFSIYTKKDMSYRF